MTEVNNGKRGLSNRYTNKSRKIITSPWLKSAQSRFVFLLFPWINWALDFFTDLFFVAETFYLFRRYILVNYKCEVWDCVVGEAARGKKRLCEIDFRTLKCWTGWLVCCLCVVLVWCVSVLYYRVLCWGFSKRLWWCSEFVLDCVCLCSSVSVF